ncbi:uncharacterized protein (DUF3820 family) [Glaciimonas immobilis]|uniref:Uncharacterized protein (DUF3820 family) n=1 Tax=Glaciimonas immobilis TaxID=728004 RepID=A0A840RYM3_9BURK|nr:uncharacterized protein (DUF3820 family) [Glaciimonas immobilis]
MRKVCITRSRILARGQVTMTGSQMTASAPVGSRAARQQQMNPETGLSRCHLTDARPNPEIGRILDIVQLFVREDRTQFVHPLKRHTRTAHDAG